MVEGTMEVPDNAAEEADVTPSLKRSKTMKNTEEHNVASQEESQQQGDEEQVSRDLVSEDDREHDDGAAASDGAPRVKAKPKVTQPKQKAKGKAKKDKPVKMSMSQVVEEVSKEQPSKLLQNVKVLRDKKKELADLKKKQARDVRNAEKKVQRLKEKTAMWSNNDLMNVFVMRMTEESQKAERAKSKNALEDASASSSKK